MSVLLKLRSSRLDDRDKCGTLIQRIGNPGCLNVACVLCLYRRVDAISTRYEDTVVEIWQICISFPSLPMTAWSLNAGSDCSIAVVPTRPPSYITVLPHSSISPWTINDSSRSCVIEQERHTAMQWPAFNVQLLVGYAVLVLIHKSRALILVSDPWLA